MSPSHIDLSEIPKPSEGAGETTREILDRIGDKWSLYISPVFMSLFERHQMRGTSRRSSAFAARRLKFGGWGDACRRCASRTRRRVPQSRLHTFGDMAHEELDPLRTPQVRVGQ